MLFVMQSSSKSKFNGLTALITGASSGMGLEYSKQLASSGCNVLMVSNQEEKLLIESELVRSQYAVQVWTKYLDLADLSAADNLFFFCNEKGLQIDILINNAGIFFFEELQGDTCRKADLMLKLHVFTPTRLCELFGNSMKSRHFGYILNVSSVAAGMTVPGLTVYASTKSYLRTFSKSLYYEMKPYGVSVTTLAPGAVSTGLYSVLPGLVRVLDFAGKFGLVYSPAKLVRRALRALSHRRRFLTPGFINHFFAPAVNSLPKPIVAWIWNRVH